MFLRLSVILFTGGGRRSPWSEISQTEKSPDRETPQTETTQTPPGQTPRDRDHPLTETPQTQTLPGLTSSGGHWNKQYASYWDTHLFTISQQYKNATIVNFILAVPLERNWTNEVCNLEVWYYYIHWYLITYFLTSSIANEKGNCKYMVI